MVIEPNRGARVRPIDADYVRDIMELRRLIEPQLTAWFCRIASTADIARLEELQDRIEAVVGHDRRRGTELDFEFHAFIYQRHYNRQAVELWRRYRDILRVIERGYPLAEAHWRAKCDEHRALIAAFGRQDPVGAAAIMAQHIDGSGRRILDFMHSDQPRS